MSVMIDIPQVAYRTWSFEYIVKDKDGKRNYELEREFEIDLERSLRHYPYSKEHDHIK